MQMYEKMLEKVKFLSFRAKARGSYKDFTKNISKELIIKIQVVHMWSKNHKQLIYSLDLILT
jgi:hypothetical protein